MLLQLQDQDYKYLENAEDATLKGSAPTRLFTIEEVRSGWWKQIPVDGRTQTVIRAHLRFRLPDNGLGRCLASERRQTATDRSSRVDLNQVSLVTCAHGARIPEPTGTSVLNRSFDPEA